jgi:hypothetical protein
MSGRLGKMGATLSTVRVPRESLRDLSPDCADGPRSPFPTLIVSRKIASGSSAVLLSPLENFARNSLARRLLYAVASKSKVCCRPGEGSFLRGPFHNDETLPNEVRNSRYPVHLRRAAGAGRFGSRAGPGSFPTAREVIMLMSTAPAVTYRFSPDNRACPNELFDGPCLLFPPCHVNCVSSRLFAWQGRHRFQVMMTTSFVRARAPFTTNGRLGKQIGSHGPTWRRGCS